MKHKLVPKGWGYEKWIVNNDQYCGKILFIAAGHRFSWHYHNEKHETFYVLAGRATMYLSSKDAYEYAQEITMNPGDSVTVHPGIRHQVAADEDTTLIEFSTHHEDADSIRVLKGD
jgi:quercetin dioxygenase-like cupin family protein